MDTQRVELALDELGIPLPAHALRTRATLDRLGELDVPLNPEQPRHYLAGQLRGIVDRGENLTGADIIEMVAANREGANNAEANQVLQLALEDAQRLHDLALTNSVRQLLPTVRSAVDDVLKQAWALPADTPTTASEAVHREAKAAEGYRTLEELASRHARLRALHRNLIGDQAQPAAVIIFGDTRRRPAVVPSQRQAPEPAGPKDAIARLKWLASPEAESWVPTAAEVTERYSQFLRELQEPKKSASSMTGETVTSSLSPERVAS